MSRIVGNLFEILSNNFKRSSFVWKHAIKDVYDNWKLFDPNQCAGILLALYRSNLHQSDECVKIANLFINNIEKYVKSADFNYSAGVKLSQFYLELDSIGRLDFGFNRIENLILLLLDNIKSKSTFDLIDILPVLAISNCNIDIDTINYIYENTLKYIRDKSIQSFLPVKNTDVICIIDHISLLAFILSNYNININPTNLLLLLGESTGNLTSLLRLHYAIIKLNSKYNLSNYLTSITSHLDNQSIWNKSEIIESTKLICNYKMYDSPYIMKLYQAICNSLETFTKMDKCDINLYLKSTLNRMDTNNVQYKFLHKIHVLGLITKPHRANIKWNSPSQVQSTV